MRVWLRQASPNLSATQWQGLSLVSPPLVLLIRMIAA